MHVYIMTNKNAVSYIYGVTSDPIARVYKHRERLIETSFTARYWLRLLVYFEEIPGELEGIAYEKKLKKWPRAWKIALIERDNPDWNDLYPGLLG